LVEEVTHWPDVLTTDCLMSEWFGEFWLPKIAPRRQKLPTFTRPSFLAGTDTYAWSARYARLAPGSVIGQRGGMPFSNPLRVECRSGRPQEAVAAVSISRCLKFATVRFLLAEVSRTIRGARERFARDQSGGKGSRRTRTTRVPPSSGVKVNVCRCGSSSGVPIGPPVAVNSNADGRSYTVTSNSEGQSFPTWCPTARNRAPTPLLTLSSMGLISTGLVAHSEWRLKSAT
jgi:hypothetical protein